MQHTGAVEESGGLNDGGSALGRLPHLKMPGRTRHYAEAIEDSAICQLGVEDVERRLISDPRIAIRISRLLGEQLARLEERLTHP